MVAALTRRFGDLDIAGDTYQHIGVVAGHAFRAHEKVDHVAQRLARRVAEIVVKAHRDIGVRGFRAGIGKLNAAIRRLVQDELEIAGQ